MASFPDVHGFRHAVALVLTALLSTGAATALGASEDGGPGPTDRRVTVEEWLVLGPMDAPPPAFHGGEEIPVDLATPGDRWSLAAGEIRPAAERSVRWPGGEVASWESRDASGGTVELTAPGDGPAEAYLAVHVTVTAWTAAALEIQGEHGVGIALDGELLELTEVAAEADVEEDSEGTFASGLTRRADLGLAPGKHRIVVRALRDPDQTAAWTIAADLVLPAEGDLPELSTSPRRPLQIHDILDAPRATGAALSPDGETVAVSMQATTPNGEAERWVTLIRTRDGGAFPVLRGGQGVGRVRWAPVGRTLGYTTTGGDGAVTVWALDLDSGAASRVVTVAEGFGDYRWAPDASFLVYSVSEAQEADPRKIDRIRHPAERGPGFRDPAHLFQVALGDGVSRQLTAGPRGLGSWAISPDGRRLLLLHGEPDYTAPPFWQTAVWELDLATLAAVELVQDPGIHDAVYSPDGERIAVLGTPTAFGGIGSTVAEGAWSPAWDHQLYLVDRGTRAVEAASRELVGGLHTIAWSEADGRIYGVCTEGQYKPVYALDPRSGTWTAVDVGIEVVSGLALARSARVAVAFGTGATTPQRLTVTDLRRGRARVLLDPGAERYRDVAFGDVEPWSVRLENGTELDGRVYYPPDFDPGRRYAAIVYYYGGVMPVTRGFGGRYPLNLWAGQEYVVYVPQPSGAVGYGQERSSLHVNDWGEITASEVIEGTQAFLEAHPFVDGERVGCIGASYGGFLTQAILTKTELFSAGISHAGISSLTSYWGVGLWGYEYGAVAMTDSYPWSHEELFVGHSPLFQADAITTPLLLLHGAEDTNVPPGESDQMFVALTLLGKDVDYVRVLGQDHHILARDRRVVWNDTILAYFARHLKGDPGWWDELYPEPGSAP